MLLENLLFPEFILPSRIYFHVQVLPVKVIKIIEIVKKKQIHSLKGFWLMQGEEFQHVKLVKEDISHNLGEQFRLRKWTFSHIVQVHSWSILTVIQTGLSRPLQYLQLRPGLQHGRDRHEQRGRCQQRLYFWPQVTGFCHKWSTQSASTPRV